MSARRLALLLAALAGCAGSAEPSRPRVLQSPAAAAIPESDPALRWAPQGSPGLVPVEQVSVRVRRAESGRPTIVEFISPGLSDAEQVKLRMSLESGELKLAREGAAGEESWVTTLLRAGSR